VATPTLASIGIPAWEQSELTRLSNAGQLSGVNPIDEALIILEESGGQGGGINSEGYGGFFGLSEDQAGVSTLESTSTSSFDTQAEESASDFAKALSVTGDNAIEAENYYQTGKVGETSSGARLFAQFLDGIGIAAPKTGSGSTPATTAAKTVNTGGSGLDGFIRGLDALLNPGSYTSSPSIIEDVLTLGLSAEVSSATQVATALVFRSAIAGVGFVVMWAGFKSLTDHKDPLTTVIQLPGQAVDQGTAAVKKGAEAAGAAAVAA
jgi:hypothetical protein